MKPQTMKLRTLLLTAIVILSGCNGKTLLYKDASRSAEERADDLLKRMTVEEKLGQLICPLGWPMYDKVSADSVTISDAYRDFIQNQHGGMLWAVFRADPWTKKTLENGLDPTLAAKAYNALQRYAMDSTRLGIPIILAEEAPHGHMAIGTTVFPTSIGLASTWDTELVELVGETIGTELQAQGATIGYGPVIDLAREPRWSRVEETYGEDVFLTSEMASAMVRGTSSKGVISTLKHFVAYGVPEGGHNGNPSIIGMRDLKENVLPTFKSAIDAGALSVMTSYNSLDGIPTTCNPELLTGVLRDEWGFKGFVVSDLESIDGLARDHKVAADKQEAGELSLNAGVDVDLGANCFSLLKESVEKGRVSKAVLDRAVKRVLVRKFEAGLFDHPYVDETAAAGLVRTPEHIEVAAQAAREGVVLLKNNGVLPLSKGMTVALIGPNADNQYNQLGDYTAPQAEDHVVTMKEGLEAKGIDVHYVKGCAVRDKENSTIAQALVATMLSDVAVVVVGGSSARDFKTRYIDTGAAVVDEESVSDMEAGEGFDRASLDLLGLQNDDVVPRRRRRHGPGRCPVRRLQPGRTPPRERSPRRGPASGLLQQEESARPRLRGNVRRSALSFRLWPELHDLRVLGPDRLRPCPRRGSDRQREEHRFPRRRRGGPAVRRGPARLHRPAAEAAPRLRPRVRQGRRDGSRHPEARGRCVLARECRRRHRHRTRRLPPPGGRLLRGHPPH